jgi:hypothetical protein
VDASGCPFGSLPKKAKIFPLTAQVLDFKGIRRPAFLTGNPPKPRRLKGLRSKPKGYQQSYPQEFWISLNCQSNQALAAETAQITPSPAAALAQIEA